MEITPQILDGKVMHQRLLPKINHFTYGIYYICLPLSLLDSIKKILPFNRFGRVSFYNKDHGNRTKDDVKPWIDSILKEHQLDNVVENITLITMPRVFGYVFNPVSFWICMDQQRAVRAVLCEVNNTFNETHSYLCCHDDHRPIHSQDWLEAEKLFHVSPFLTREGHYRFRFDMNHQKLGIWIDYYNQEKQKQLITALTGKLIPLTKKNINRMFFKHPLVTFKAIIMIHWQAIKIVTKRIRYIPKPPQLITRLSKSSRSAKHD